VCVFGVEGCVCGLVCGWGVVLVVECSSLVCGCVVCVLCGVCVVYAVVLCGVMGVCVGVVWFWEV
jgi:hypothetical protein